MFRDAVRHAAVSREAALQRERVGDVAYVDFLIPALAAVNGLFAGGAVGVAEDTESGLFDRLRSLPVPRLPRSPRPRRWECRRRETG